MTLAEELSEPRRRKLTDLFFDIAVMGYTMGLFTPAEWHANYNRSLLSIVPYDQLEKYREDADEAMIFFYRETYPENFDHLSDHELLVYMDDCYAAQIKWIEGRIIERYERNRNSTG